MKFTFQLNNIYMVFEYIVYFIWNISELHRDVRYNNLYLPVDIIFILLKPYFILSSHGRNNKVLKPGLIP